MAITARPGSFEYPTISGAMPPTSREAMDAAVQTVRGQKNAWAELTIRKRLALIDQLMRDFAAMADRWVDVSIQAKRIPRESPMVGEEWILGPYPILRNLRQLRGALADIERRGRPRIPGPITTRPDGQVVARVFPQTTYDSLFFPGGTAEVWMEPGVTIADLPSTQAVAYYERQREGRVALVLGAGNVSSIGPLDALYKLFVENQVVVFKANPVNAYLGPLMEEALRALVEPGYLRVVYGGAAEGSYLCNHPDVDEVHITGSDKTFEAIIFGTGAEGAQRKAERRPLLNKKVTGELGNVSPVIVVPGPWSASDIAYQAEHIASMLTNNAGFNCNATRMILQHASWNQREQVLVALRKVLAKVPSRVAYYPGAHDRHAAFIAAHPDAEQFGDASDDHLPWTLIGGVDAENKADIALNTEAFCSLFAESAIHAASVPEYVDRAVQLANEHHWGTLNATILVHPRSLKDPETAAAVERAVANLRYGSVAVNYWAASSYILGVTPWGGFPGSDIYDIQSGNGWVHNTLMFSRPQKSVVRMPFRGIPTPPFFVSQLGKGGKLFRKLSALEAAPSLAKVPSILWTALAG